MFSIGWQRSAGHSPDCEAWCLAACPRCTIRSVVANHKQAPPALLHTFPIPLHRHCVQGRRYGAPPLGGLHSFAGAGQRLGWIQKTPRRSLSNRPSPAPPGAGNEYVTSRRPSRAPLRMGTCSTAAGPVGWWGVKVHRRHALEQKKWKEDPPPPRVQPPPPPDPPSSLSSNAGGSLSWGPGKFFRLTVSGAT